MKLTQAPDVPRIQIFGKCFVTSVLSHLRVPWKMSYKITCWRSMW
jgi:hypothetical protein